MLYPNPRKPEGYEDTLKDLKYMKANLPEHYERSLAEKKLMAMGGNPDGIRIVYPEWSDEDFQNIVNEAEKYVPKPETNSENSILTTLRGMFHALFLR